MTLINFKVELKLKWTNHCVLSAVGTDNADTNYNNIMFTIKDTKLYVPIIPISAKNNQKLSNVFSKGFERSVYCYKYKMKCENRYATDKYRYFLESNFVGVMRLFVLIHSNQDDNAKRYKARRYCLPKSVIKNYNVIINRKNFYNQSVDPDLKI